MNTRLFLVDVCYITFTTRFSKHKTILHTTFQKKPPHCARNLPHRRFTKISFINKISFAIESLFKLSISALHMGVSR